MIDRRTLLKTMALSAAGGLRLNCFGLTRSQGKTVPGKETKIFDPADGFGSITDAFAITDASVVKRGDRWWMYLAGRAITQQSIQLFSASLPEGAPLSAAGWKLAPDGNDKTKIGILAGQEISKGWDLKGGRHCPSYVKGWDPQRK